MATARLFCLFVFLLCLFCLCGCASSAPPKTAAPQTALASPQIPEKSAALTAANTPTPGPTPKITLPPQIDNPRLLIEKADRRMTLYDGDTFIKSYRVGLGSSPEGHKKKEGDGKTPEGEYYICTKNPNSNFHLSFGVSYPSTKDALSALDEGLIDEDTFEKIKKANDKTACPPWNTAMGGEICIHGRGSSRDWTAGCIAVDDEEMDELWDIIGIGCPVTILP